MIIGAYYLTEEVDGAPARAACSRRSTRRSLAYEERLLGRDGETRVAAHEDQGADAGRQVPGRSLPASASTTAPRQSIVLREYGSNGDDRGARRDVARAVPAQRGVPGRLPVRRPRRCRSATSPRSSSELVVLYDKAVVAESLDKLKALGFEWSTRAGLTISISDVTTPPAKAGLLEKFEGEADQGREPVRPRHHHRRRAAPAGDRDLDRRHQPGDAGHAGPACAVDEVQPDRHDGRLGCPRKRHAGASDRRYAWPRRQPAG